MAVTFVGGFLVQVLPFLKTPVLLLFQVLAFLPFFFYLPPLLAEKTREIRRDTPHYYSGFFLAHFPLFMVISILLNAYLNLSFSGMEESLLTELNNLASGTVLEGGDEGIISYALSLILDVAGGVPSLILHYLSKFIRNLCLYFLLILGMIMMTEGRRLSLLDSSL